MDKKIKILVDKGNTLLKMPFEPDSFTENPEANKLLNDIKQHPHFFVSACVMDRQINAKKAWIIPYKISETIGSYKIKDFLKLSEKQIQKIFIKDSLHRFNKTMAKYFYLAIQLIHSRWNDDASNIWSNKPSCASVIRRFLAFKGIGVKISTMATNILVRHFKIPLKDKRYLDISPDIQNLRVFYRMGFIPDKKNIDDLIYCARELYPEYPGVFDLSTWKLGRDICRPRNPLCNECYLVKNCPKIGVN